MLARLIISKLLIPGLLIPRLVIPRLLVSRLLVAALIGLIFAGREGGLFARHEARLGAEMGEVLSLILCVVV